jgi:hypothetical protein
MNKNYSILWFVLLTVALSFGAYFLPLPAEGKNFACTRHPGFYPNVGQRFAGLSRRGPEWDSATVLQRPRLVDVDPDRRGDGRVPTHRRIQMVVDGSLCPAGCSPNIFDRRTFFAKPSIL